MRIAAQWCTDPPYAPLTATANFTAYHTNIVSNLEQQVLLAQKGGIADEKSASRC
ncbi:DNA adenine methylase [Klebsiella pneumoniae subsp. pneumoniae]|nr:DNA adenine methylase [Klebsiella pneumoniae subsp. pneumoniae]